MLFFIQERLTHYHETSDAFVHPMEESISLLLSHAEMLWDKDNCT